MSIGTQSLDDFVAALREKTPTPGGGAAAASVGRMGAALFGMVLRYSGVRRGVGSELAAVLAEVDASVDDLVTRLGALADEDCAAYSAVRSALALEKDGDQQAKIRAEAVQAASLEASEVPLRTLRLCLNGLEMMVALLDRLSPRLASDTRSASGFLAAAACSAAHNVRANFPGLKGEDQERLTAVLDECLPRVASLVSQVEKGVAVGANISK